MTKQYWIRIKGDVEGPYRASRIAEMAANGQIPRSAEISADGEKYCSISAVRGWPFIKKDERESGGPSSRPTQLGAAPNYCESAPIEPSDGRLPLYTPRGATRSPATIEPEVGVAGANEYEITQRCVEVSTTKSETSKAYDVFVCYRRRGKAAVIAHLVKEKLERAGFSVFVDVDALKEGSWFDALRKRIEECTDFIPIITEGFFDRCQDESDVVRRELKLAMESDKNIVPLLATETPFPSDIPVDLSRISTYNGVRYTHKYLDGCMDKLRHMLKAGQVGLARLDTDELTPKFVVIVTGLVFALMYGGMFVTIPGKGFTGLMESLSYLFIRLVMVPVYMISGIVPIFGALFSASLVLKRAPSRLYCSRDWIVFWVLYLLATGLVAAIAGAIATALLSLILPSWLHFTLLFVGMITAFVAVGYFLKLLFKKKWWRMALFPVGKSDL